MTGNRVSVQECLILNKSFPSVFNKCVNLGQSISDERRHRVIYECLVAVRHQRTVSAMFDTWKREHGKVQKVQAWHQKQLLTK